AQLWVLLADGVVGAVVLHKMQPVVRLPPACGDALLFQPLDEALAPRLLGQPGDLAPDVLRHRVRQRVDELLHDLRREGLLDLVQQAVDEQVVGVGEELLGLARQVVHVDRPPDALALLLNLDQALSVQARQMVPYGDGLHADRFGKVVDRRVPAGAQRPDDEPACATRVGAKCVLNCQGAAQYSTLAAGPPIKVIIINNIDIILPAGYNPARHRAQGTSYYVAAAPARPAHYRRPSY